jgi:hypothetical protein
MATDAFGLMDDVFKLNMDFNDENAAPSACFACLPRDEASGQSICGWVTHFLLAVSTVPLLARA